MGGKKSKKSKNKRIKKNGVNRSTNNVGPVSENELDKIDDDNVDFYKMEYKICRNKIDDIDKILKDIRFQGISVITGFTGAVGFLLNFEHWIVSFLFSILIVILISIIWGYDFKFFVFLHFTAKRAREIEGKFETHYKISKTKMISHAINSYHDVISIHATSTVSIMYSLFIIILDLLLLYSALNIENGFIPFVIALIVIFSSLYYIIWMRKKVKQVRNIMDESNPKK